MTLEDILAAAKDLPIDDLRRLARELTDHKATTEVRAAATAVLERWPDAATLMLTYAGYDNGVFLEPVAVLDADGRSICSDGEAIAAVCDDELTEISRSGHEPGHRPCLDLATAELRFDGSGHADLAYGANGAGAAASATTTLRAELDAVTLTTLIAAAERAVAADDHDFDADDLDEDVHDAASDLGATTNNAGVGAQIAFLAAQLGVSYVRACLASRAVTPGPDDLSAAAARSAGGVIGYDRWEDFAGTLTDRARTDPDGGGVDVDRVPDHRRAEIVAAWRFGAFDQSAQGADAWWTATGGPWFDRVQEALIADGYGLAD